MPGCQQCSFFMADENRCEFNPLAEDHPHWHKAEMRSCHKAILVKHHAQWKGQDLLEVGHGVSNMVRRMCRRIGGTWYGIDPRWPDNPDDRHWGAGVADMPFEDNRFDWCVAMETIEHWCEYNETIPAGLNEIHRVLKPGGTLLLSAPFFVHGDDPFYYGRVDEVKKFFETDQWSTVLYEEWRRKYTGRPVIQGWRAKYQRRALQRHYAKRAKKLIKEVGHEPVTWKMEIVAVKK